MLRFKFYGKTKGHKYFFISETCLLTPVFLTFISVKKIFLLLFVIAGCTASSPSDQDTIKRVDAIMDKYKPGNPGAEMAISRDGEIIYFGVRAWPTWNIMHRLQRPLKARLDQFQNNLQLQLFCFWNSRASFQ